ncbi:uncharacterized protein LOC116352380 [Contarinia nasturtii]|uniref:uncharacterized protein LOC116352380 n=1 Tax=Contarinia nasturtii TaxID=265458 RepID=UPI0012D3E00B|nr:uncharacterized protein LOC116352380 [Contarinia nasturtii]
MNLLKTSILLFVIFAVVGLNHAGSDSEQEEEEGSVMSGCSDPEEQELSGDDPDHKQFDNPAYKKHMDARYKVLKRKIKKNQMCCNGNACKGCQKELAIAQDKYDKDHEKADAGTLKTGMFEKTGSGLQKRVNKLAKVAKSMKKTLSKKK